MRLSFGIPKETSMTASDELLTVGELAARLKIKPSWVYSHADDLGAFRLGKYLRFSLRRVMERLESGEASGSRAGSPTQQLKITPTNDNTSDDRGTNREQNI
jgi:hypothetical protein